MGDLADVSTGDVITAQRQNDINDYIHDGTHKINTLSIDVGGTEVIDSSRNADVESVSIDGTEVISSDSEAKFPKILVSTGGGKILFYANDGTTKIAELDESGNFGIKGRVYSL